MILVHFQGKPFKITLIQVCDSTTNAEEAEVEWFYEDLQDLLELTPIPKNGNDKECSNYHTIALISHANKVMLKILQAGFSCTRTENFLMYEVGLENA